MIFQDTNLEIGKHGFQLRGIRWNPRFQGCGPWVLTFGNAQFFETKAQFRSCPWRKIKRLFYRQVSISVGSTIFFALKYGFIPDHSAKPCEPFYITILNVDPISRLLYTVSLPNFAAELQRPAQHLCQTLPPHSAAPCTAPCEAGGGKVRRRTPNL